MRKPLLVFMAILALMPLSVAGFYQTSSAPDGDGRSRTTPYAPGQAGNVGDYALRVVGVTPDATVDVLAENMFNSPPEAGNAFFIARIEATYLGRDTGKPGSDLKFNIVGSKNRGYSEYMASCGVIPDSSSQAPELFTEGSVEFNVCWSVPEEEVGSFVMYVEPWLSNDRVWFALQSGTDVAADIKGEEAAASVSSLEATDISFSESQIIVKPGDTIELTNTGMLEHDFMVDELGIHEVTPSTGDTVTIVIPKDADSGVYQFYCSVPGHKAAGMVGTLIVTSAEAGDHDMRPNSSEATEQGGGTTIVILAKDIAFDPSIIEVSAGDTITVANMGALEHDFAVDAWGGVLIGPLAGGESGSYTVPSVAQLGETFDFYCSIPGHKESGMVGKITVAAAGGGEAAASPEASPAAVGTGNTLEIAANEWEYSPAEFEAAPGDTIVLRNDGAMAHDMSSEEWGEPFIADVAHGETGSFVVPDDAKVGSTIKIYSMNQGAEKLGMSGTITIVEKTDGDLVAGASTPTASPEAAASPVASPAGEEASGAAGGGKTIDVKAVDLAFDPSEFEASPGDTIKLTNEGQLEHDMASETLDTMLIDVLASGESGEYVIPDDASGEIEIHCTIPGHKEAGMVGKITIV